MMNGRKLERDEIQAIWTIDRSEVIEAVYSVEQGNLVLKLEHYDVRGWAPDQADKSTPLLQDCYDRGGWLYGLFDDGRLAGFAVLESKFIQMGLLQLVFLHVSRAFRNQGWGEHLFDLAAAEARRRGAQGLYISATPSEHTIRFYLRLGCRVTGEPDAELFALEPEDIHLEYVFAGG